jgi:putative tryptophan/tyrosine transport system substrate-binding protein
MKLSCQSIGLCAAVLLTPGLDVDAQPAPKIPRIGWLGMDSATQTGLVEVFAQGLRDLGYIEGKTIIIERRWAERDFSRLPQLAAELVALPVDIIVTAAPPAVRAARHATTTIPIVMLMHEPVRMGVVESLARPGGNVTGQAFQDTELTAKRLDLFRQTVPAFSRLAILWNSAGTDAISLQHVESTAKTMGLQTLSIEVRGPGEFAAAVSSARAWGAQGVLQMASPMMTTNRKALIEQFKSNKLPATCELRMYVDDGCLMTYSADLTTIFRRQASYVDRILKGAKPADLAIEQPREFDFVINETTAHDLGLTIPTSVRMQATAVVK